MDTKLVVADFEDWRESVDEAVGVLRGGGWFTYGDGVWAGGGRL